MKFEVEFPFPAKHFTMNDRLHWRQRASLTRIWRSAATVRVQAAHVGLRGPSTVQYHFAGIMVHDPANLAPVCKAMTDGLVDAGVWPTDSDRWVTELPSTVERHRWPLVERRVRITITPRSADE